MTGCPAKYTVMVLMTAFVALTGSQRPITSGNFTGAVVLVALRVPTLVLESGFDASTVLQTKC